MVLAKCLIKPWCRVVGAQRTVLAVSATQATFCVLAWLSPGGNAGEKFIKLAPTGDISPKVAAFTFVCVVAEAGMRTAAVAWEAPAKRSIVAPFG